MMTNLKPNDSHKSFYGKAKVETLDGIETLYSYGTRIMSRDTATGKLFVYWHGWTATTGRHIKAFCGLNKAGYNALIEEQVMKVEKAIEKALKAA